MKWQWLVSFQLSEESEGRGTSMERHEKAIGKGLRNWLLILLAGNALFAVVNLGSAIGNATDVGLMWFELFQLITCVICVLNIVFIRSVLRLRKRGVYGLVAGLGSASAAFALSVWLSATEPSEMGEAIVWAAVIFAVGLVITVVWAMLLRPVMIRPSHQTELPAEPSASASDSPDTQDDGDFDTAQ
jgi:hypothetical protein